MGAAKPTLASVPLVRALGGEFPTSPCGAAGPPFSPAWFPSFRCAPLEVLPGAGFPGAVPPVGACPFGVFLVLCLFAQLPPRFRNHIRWGSGPLFWCVLPLGLWRWGWGVFSGPACLAVFSVFELGGRTRIATQARFAFGARPNELGTENVERPGFRSSGKISGWLCCGRGRALPA